MMPQNMQSYVLLKSAIFWLLIFLAWLSYPAEHSYSILSHTFSFLGSWSEEHNPRYWWIFTLAMVFWGVAMLPLILYSFQRFRSISGWGAGVGALFMAVGAVGTVLVGLLPDAREPLYGNMRWTDAHEIAAIMVGVGFALGIFWHTGLILVDRFGHRHFRHAHGFGHRSIVWPHLLWFGVIAVAVHNQVTWAQTYEARKAAAHATGENIGTSWGESLHTIYAFPLWENIVIYTLYAFIVWFTLALHWAHKQEENT